VEELLCAAVAARAVCERHAKALYLIACCALGLEVHLNLQQHTHTEWREILGILGM
jgi:hypothetical protein